MFTDIEGSTRLWEEHDRAMESVMTQHDRLLHQAIDAAGGVVFKHTGDGVAAAFPDARCAAMAALQAQQAVAAADWQVIDELRVRMGIHSGSAQQRDGEFFGRDVNRAARVMDAAHGGQVLLSGPTAVALAVTDGDEWSLRDLGVYQLKDLSDPERVFQLCHPALMSGFPALKTVDRIPRNIPAVTEFFVGRDKEIRILRKLLRDGRLVVLTGPGGVGKTQLALATAAERLRDYPDGTWFCSLTNAGHAEDIAHLIETAMGLEITGGSSALGRVISGLASRRVLIILDGVELAGSGLKQLVGTLLESCQNTSFLCTSREVLHARGEQVLAIGPLELPAAEGFDAHEARANGCVSLFERRAQLADGNFALNAENVAAVIEICRQLDGLPLAVELAAAQMGTFSPQDLAKRIGRRVSLIDDRQQTLRSIIDWSYESLSAPQRRLFQRLAIFAGGFSLALAERVCADDEIPQEDIMPRLADLVNKSVIAVTRTADGNRYLMLELLRSYAMSQATDYAELEQQRQRHLEAYLEFLAAAREGLTTRSEVDWVKRIENDFANIRAAFSWAMESGQVDRALKLIHYVDGFARDRNRQEIDPWAEQALAAAMGDETYLFAAQAVLASKAARAGEIMRATALSDESVDSARRTGAENAFMPFQQAAIAGIFSGDTQRFLRSASEAIRRATEERRPAELARFHVLMAHGLALRGDLEAAAESARTALQQARSLGNPSALAWSLYAAGAYEPDEELALALLEEAIEFADMVGNKYIAGNALQIASYRRKSGSRAEIALGYSRVLNHWYRVANWTNLTSTFRMCVESMPGWDDELIATIHGWLRHSREIGGFGGIPAANYDEVIKGTRERLGVEAFEAVADRGSTMDAAHLVRYSRDALAHQARLH